VRPTIREVAREAGVSIATVSHALSGKRPVSLRTRVRIEHTADRLGYRPNAIAAAMPTGRTQTLGMIVPDLANPFFGELLGAVERTAAARGYSLVASSSELDLELEARAVRALHDRRVDALLYLGGCEQPNDAFAELARGDVKLVCLDEELPYLPPESSLVVVDNEEGGALAGQHLLECGHRELAVVGGPAGLPTARARLDGFRRTARAAGAEPATARVSHAATYTIEAGRDAALELLRRERAVTAVFCANDLIALGACAAARELGRQVPGDLSVVGFDDSLVAALVTPALTTIRQPLARLGKEAADAAIDLVEGTRTAPLRLTLPVQLVVRESTAPPSGGVPPTTPRRIG
jgi:DNA-binding LacI/PurR family transcriptional regulator